MGFSQPKATAPTPPPPPVSASGADAAAASEDERRKQRRRMGYQSTLLAGQAGKMQGLGMAEPKRTLLGG